jgi:uncharacterized protein YjbI with pentapeptide repeats
MESNGRETNEEPIAPDLSEANLSEANLRGANLSQVDLRRAGLFRADGASSGNSDALHSGNSGGLVPPGKR